MHAASHVWGHRDVFRAPRASGISLEGCGGAPWAPSWARASFPPLGLPTSQFKGLVLVMDGLFLPRPQLPLQGARGSKYRVCSQSVLHAKTLCLGPWGLVPRSSREAR